MSNSLLEQDDSTRIAPQVSHGDMSESRVDNHALPVGSQLFEFEIRQVVGCGGFGIVYSAFDKSLNREVALKEYMPTAFARRSHGTTVSMLSEEHAETFQAGMRSFINEAKLLAQFDHDSLVKVYRFWEANGTAYMVMPMYKGKTLTAVLNQKTVRPTEAWLRDFLAHLLDALAVMHAKNCFHRDIAPDNIIMQNDGRPVLLDFGAARHVLEGEQQSLTIILKPSYAPIEQYGNSASMSQGPWTDLYALASVIHLAIMGKVPQASMQRLIEDKQPRLGEVAELAMPGHYSQVFLAAIDQALALKPKDRPQSVAEFQLLLGLDSPRPVRKLSSATSTPVKSKWARHLGASLALVCGLLIVVWLFTDEASFRETPHSVSTGAINTENTPILDVNAATAPNPINTEQEAIARNERLQQLKILDEKQQAITIEMDKLALLKKTQEVNTKVQQLANSEREKQAKLLKRTVTEKATVTAKNTADIKPLVQQVSIAEQQKMNAPVANTPPPEEKTPTKKSEKKADLFVTPGF